MQTRCKFQVVGVEDVDHKVGMTRVYEGTQEFNESDSNSEGVEYENGRLGNARKYRVQWNGKRAQNVRLAACYDPSNPEDVSFAESTPSGEVKIYVSNPVVVGTFVPGKKYYLDIIPCE